MQVDGYRLSAQSSATWFSEGQNGKDEGAQLATWRTNAHLSRALTMSIVYMPQVLDAEARIFLYENFLTDGKHA